MAGYLDTPTLARPRLWSRRLRAGLRDTWVLMREFRQPLILFLITLLVGAISFRALWNTSQPEVIRLIEAVYVVLTMTFFQPVLEFPQQWYLDIYFFLMPALGLFFLARGAADFVTLLFNRSSRLTQWEEAVAAVFRDHIIVAGLGHLGVRVVRELVALDEEIVAIEQRAESPRFGEVRKHGIPIIVGDARDPSVLEKAGLDRASAIIICTNDDLANLQIASRIREQNKHVRLVMRMFDDEFARSMADRFDVSAVMSASMMAAPAFAGAATRVEIVQTFRVQDRVLAMGRVEVQTASKLDGKRTQEVEDALDLSIVLHQSGEAVDVRPEPDVVLRPGDVIAVVAALPAIKKLAAEWNRPKKR
jgi:Trk K+ transport system NAD-binding subunit